MSTQKLAELVHYHHRPLLKAAETGQFCLAEVKAGSHNMSRQQRYSTLHFSFLYCKQVGWSVSGNSHSWQRSPARPMGQRQRYPLISSTHVAPYEQGED